MKTGGEGGAVAMNEAKKVTAEKMIVFVLTLRYYEDER